MQMIKCHTVTYTLAVYQIGLCDLILSGHFDAVTNHITLHSMPSGNNMFFVHVNITLCHL